MDTHPIEDEEHHLRTFLLRLERRLMDLNREMGVQENLHRVLKQQERELEERLLERERRLAEAHEVGRLLDRPHLHWEERITLLSVLAVHLDR